jgi:hypothetical protein
MAKNLPKSYGKGIGLVEKAYMSHGPSLDFDIAVSDMLYAAERSRAPDDMATAEGAAHAVEHLKSQGLVMANPRATTPKMLAAQARSSIVLKRAHAILASRGCSFKDAMVTAWTEAKTKANGGRGMDQLHRQAMDGQEWAQYLEARAGNAYNVPEMYANGGRKGVKRNSSPTRGQDALWTAAYDGQPWAKFEMARTGRSYNVPNMWAGQGMSTDELAINATKRNPGLKKGQNIMKLAAKRYHAGEFSSMQEAVSAVAAERRR